MDATSPGFAPGRGPSAPAGLAVSLSPASLPRMLPSPATSTPFSVKDILKLEQQQQQQQQHLGGPVEPPFAPAAASSSCLLSCRFSEGEEDEESEEQQPFLTPMASTKSQADGGFSPGSYVQAVLRGTCEPKGLAEEAGPARDSGTGEYRSGGGGDPGRLRGQSQSPPKPRAGLRPSSFRRPSQEWPGAGITRVALPSSGASEIFLCHPEQTGMLSVPLGFFRGVSSRFAGLLQPALNPFLWVLQVVSALAPPSCWDGGDVVEMMGT